MTTSQLLLIPGYALTIKMVQYGLGQHIGCIQLTGLIHLSKFIIIGEVLLVFSTLFSRVSICLFLLRIFTVNKSWRWTLYTIIGLTTVVNIILVATNLSQCKPRAKLWNPLLPGKCWDHQVILGIAYFQGGQWLLRWGCLAFVLSFVHSRLCNPRFTPISFSHLLPAEYPDELANQSCDLRYHVSWSNVSFPRTSSILAPC